MDLSIIIVNWNTRDLLDACLASVYASTGGLQMEVYVVDNASGDGSAAMVRERYPQVRLIQNTDNRGFAAANNQAIAVAGGRYVLLLNSDAALPPTGAAELVRFADSCPQAGILGCRLVNPDGSFQAGPNDLPTVWSALLDAWGLAKWLYRNPHYPSSPPEHSASTRQCGWVGGACLLARSEAIADVGPLDEGYAMNSEEVDWCWRMRAAGWQVWYLHTTDVRHVGGASGSRRSARQYQRLIGGKLRFIRKRYGRVAAAVVSISHRISQLTRAAAWWIWAVAKPSTYARERARVCWQVATAGRWT